MAQCLTHGRTANPCRRGSCNPRAILTEDDIWVIRDLKGHVLQVEMAVFFNTGVTTISAVQTRQNWSFLKKRKGV